MLPLTQLSRRIDRALNQFKALDLAQRNSDFGSCEPYDPKKPWYPGISIRNSEDALDDIPEEGTAVVKYKVTRRGYDERNGKKKHDISMDLLSFDPQEAKKAEEAKKKAGEAVEMGVKRTGVSALHSFAGRPRDGDGQFVANVTGGADPVTMRQAYGDKQPQASASKLLAPGAVAGTLASAGLLGTQKGRGMVVKAAKGASRMVRSAVTGIERKVKGRDTGRYPVMGSRAPKGQRKEGLGEVIYRQGMAGRKRPVSGD